MLKKTIEWEDYDGNKRKEDFYFNLTKAELMEMELGTVGGLEKLIESIISAQDAPEISKLFKRLILMSYGEKSADGKRFIKNQELTDAFTQTEAYSILYMELATDEEAAAKFVNGILPKDLAAEAATVSSDKIAELKALTGN